MATKITTCEKCKSRNIKELNTEVRKTTKAALCEIECECNDCGHLFTIASHTDFGIERRILY